MANLSLGEMQLKFAEIAQMKVDFFAGLDII